ncbi:MAG TPA: hypothetical protein DCR14_01975, partial [Acidimicrobiaceae bacterium]|nr:hypothetical protein [Acidimicrobiaceae bacterium]
MNTPSAHTAMRGTTRQLLTIALITATATTLTTLAPLAATPVAAEQSGGVTIPDRGQLARIATGEAHTCVIIDAGEVTCWGSNAHGQLGSGQGTSVAASIGNDERPADIGMRVSLPGGRTAVALAAGAFHTCAVLDNGGVSCWGEADLGRLGYGNQFDIGDNETP